MTPDRSSPFDDLRAALSGDADLGILGEDATPTIRLDLTRAARTGVPEVIHAERKSPEAIAVALVRLATRDGRAIASRVRPDAVHQITAQLPDAISTEWHDRAHVLIAVKDDAPRASNGGIIGVLAAGTSDAPVAAEAVIMAREMGATVLEAFDVGVAGLHRLVQPLEEFHAAGVDVIIVAAGMDGALPSVVAGLVDVPVIGLPTSIGYGFGGQGVGALTTMLQSCAPGLAVVNIDNGIGAGSTAALIARRAAKSR